MIKAVFNVRATVQQWTYDLKIQASSVYKTKMVYQMLRGNRQIMPWAKMFYGIEFNVCFG